MPIDTPNPEISPEILDQKYPVGFERAGYIIPDISQGNPIEWLEHLTPDEYDAWDRWSEDAVSEWDDPEYCCYALASLYDMCIKYADSHSLADLFKYPTAFVEQIDSLKRFFILAKQHRSIAIRYTSEHKVTDSDTGESVDAETKCIIMISLSDEYFQEATLCIGLADMLKKYLLDPKSAQEPDFWQSVREFRDMLIEEEPVAVEAIKA